MSFFSRPRAGIPSLVALAALELCSFLFFFDFSHRLRLELQSERPLNLQLYWARPGKGYDERNSRSIAVAAGKTVSRIDFSSLPMIERLRIDPGQAPGTVRLVSLTFERPLAPTLVQGGRSGWNRLRALADTGLAAADAGSMRVRIQGVDPQLELALSSRVRIVWSWLWYAAKSAVVALALWLFCLSFWRRLSLLSPVAGILRFFDRERDRFGSSAAFVFFLLLLLFAFFFFDDSYHLRMETETAASGTLRVYWAGEGEGYNEAFSAPLAVGPGRSAGELSFASLRSVQRLRLDPPPEAGEFCFRRLSLERRLFPPRVFEQAGDFAAFRPLRDIASFRYEEGRGFCLRPVPEAPAKPGKALSRDPYLELDATIVPPAGDFFRWTAQWLAKALGAAFAGWCICLWAGNRMAVLADRENFVAAAVAMALAGAVLLAAVMAFVSPYRLHPDEHVHFTASEYYSAHWLPPAIGAPGLDESYSVYGFSRLNNLDASYWFAGSFMRLASIFTGPGHVAARLFCVTLLACLALIACVRKRWAIFMTVLLVSPQLWYIFSYINNDALPLFLTILMACALADGKNFLFRDKPGLNPLPLTAMGLMAGMLVLEKDNFLVFVLYAALFSGWRILFSGPGKIRLCRRLAVLVLVALSVVSARHALDYAVNGSLYKREARILAVAEEKARPDLRPSLYNAARDTYYGLNLRAKGIAFTEIFTHWKWHLLTAQSFAGEFGLKNMPSPPWYYRLVYYLYAGVFFYLLGRGLAWGNWRLAGVTMLTAGATGGLILVAAYSSWTSDFQAQGRYLFPLAGVMALHAQEVWQRINRGLVTLVLVAFFFLSLYSFVASGIVPMAAFPR